MEINNHETVTDLRYFFEGITLGIILFTINLELNPKLGNILFRDNSIGRRVFNPFALLDYFKIPFINYIFWKPRNWDLNIYIFSFISGTSWLYLRKVFNHYYY